MGRPNPVKGGHLHSRDYIRCCLAIDFLNEPQISSKKLRERYYNTVTPDSFHRTFKRDRVALEEAGLYLIEKKDGASKLWSLDKGASLANLGQISDTERRTIALLLRAYLTNPELDEMGTIGACIARIGQDSCAGLQQLPATEPLCQKEVLQKVGEAYRLRKPLRISYQSLQDASPVERTIQPWGIFSLGRNVYVVGLRSRKGSEDSLRTLNLERIKKAEIIDGASTFEIPADFSVQDYRLLPFEIGPDEVSASFYVDPIHASEFSSLVGKRGEFVSAKDGTTLWKVVVKDVLLAASWAIENGVLPTSPKQLIDAWQQLNEEVLGDEH